MTTMQPTLEVLLTLIDTDEALERLIQLRTAQDTLPGLDPTELAMEIDLAMNDVAAQAPILQQVVNANSAWVNEAVGPSVENIEALLPSTGLAFAVAWSDELGKLAADLGGRPDHCTAHRHHALVEAALCTLDPAHCIFAAIENALILETCPPLHHG